MRFLRKPCSVVTTVNGFRDRRARSGTTTTERTVTSDVRFSGDNRLLLPGTVLTREYKGDTLQVRVLENGFEYEGEVYRSLSAVAVPAVFVTPLNVCNLLYCRMLRCMLASAVIFANKTCQKLPADRLCDLGLADTLQVS